MKNLYDEDDDYDYRPNELAHLSVDHRKKYREIVESNLEPGDTVEKWEQRNLERAQEYLRQQRGR